LESEVSIGKRKKHHSDSDDDSEQVEIEKKQ